MDPPVEGRGGAGRRSLQLIVNGYVPGSASVFGAGTVVAGSFRTGGAGSRSVFPTGGGAPRESVHLTIHLNRRERSAEPAVAAGERGKGRGSAVYRGTVGIDNRALSACIAVSSGSGHGTGARHDTLGDHVPYRPVMRASGRCAPAVRGQGGEPGFRISSYSRGSR